MRLFGNFTIWVVELADADGDLIDHVAFRSRKAMERFRRDNEAGLAKSGVTILSCGGVTVFGKSFRIDQD